MKKLCFISLILMSVAIQAKHYNMSDYEDHNHKTMVDGKELTVEQGRFDRFIKDDSGGLVAIVSVQRMVCDFCARGIEKTFGKDKHVKKIDIDLASGKILLAYTSGTTIDRADIKTKILNNGLNTTDIQIVGK